MARQTLGDVYDTKVLVINSPSLSKLDAFKSLAGSSLADVWALCQQHPSFKAHPQIDLPAGFRRYQTKALHDASIYVYIYIHTYIHVYMYMYRYIRVYTLHLGRVPMENRAGVHVLVAGPQHLHRARHPPLPRPCPAPPMPSSVFGLGFQALRVSGLRLGVTFRV